MRSLLSSVCSAAVVGGLLVGSAGTATAAGPAHRPAPPTLSKSSVAEDATVGSLIGVLSSNDPDTGFQHTFSLVAGKGSEDNKLVRVQGTRLEVAGPLDHESDPRLSVRIRVTDKVGHTRDKRFSIAVRDVNEAPTAIKLAGGSVAENAPAGTGVGTLSTVDPDEGDTFTYTVLSGPFRASGNSLRTTASFDYESATTQRVRVRSTDAAGHTVDSTMSIAVTDVAETDEPPIVVAPGGNNAPYHLTPTSASVAENEDEGTLVAQATAIDPDGDPLTYSLVASVARCSRPHGHAVAQRRGCGPENPFVVASNGKITTLEPLNYEYRASYDITVKATDPGGLSTQENITISVLDVNEAPRNLWLSNTTIDEGEAGIEVGTLSAYDPEADVLTYSIEACAPPRIASGIKHRSLCRIPVARFVVDGDKLVTDVDLEHDYTPTLDVTVKATDPDGLSTTETFTITVNAVNHAPTDLTISNTFLDSDSPWDLVGYFSTTDADSGDTFTYSIVSARNTSNTDVSQFFEIDGGDELWATSDFCSGLSDGVYYVKIKVTDAGGLSYDETFTITVGALGRHAAGAPVLRRGC